MKGSRSRFLPGLTIVLAALLVLSNGWWLYARIDDIATEAVRSKKLDTGDLALKQAVTLLPVAFAAQDKEGFLAAAEQQLRTAGPEAGNYEIAGETLAHLVVQVRERGGCVWIGELGFRFDDDGMLQQVSYEWFGDEDDPCYPSGS